MTSKDDKPEMPERIWAQVEHYEGRGYYYPDKMGNDCFLYLPADKVREAFREMLDGVCCGEPDCICNGYVVRLWASKLFPEGVEE